VKVMNGGACVDGLNCKTEIKYKVEYVVLDQGLCSFIWRFSSASTRHTSSRANDILDHGYLSPTTMKSSSHV